MSTQPSQAVPLNTLTFNDSYKRRHSQGSPQSERPISRPGADSINGQGSAEPKRDEKRRYIHSSGPKRTNSTSSVLLYDVTNTQKDEATSSGIPSKPSLVETQQKPMTEPGSMINEETSALTIDSVIQRRPFQELGYVEPVSSGARLEYRDLQVIINDPSQGRGPSVGFEMAPRESNNHQTPPSATEAVVTPGVASIVVPTVLYYVVATPPYGIGTNTAYNEGYDPEHPRNYESYIAEFTARPAAPRVRDYEYRPMPEMLDIEMLNQRLNLVVPDFGDAARLFRELPEPPRHIDSELARCVRFAQSDSQRRIDWRAHPIHVAEIIQRTNFYGMELLISRDYMRISLPPTKDEFELAMATRVAHTSFGKDPVAYIAADVPAPVNYLVENVPSAICLIPNRAKDHFSEYTELFRVELAERHPPLSDIGLPTWRLLLDGERGQPSLKAQSLQHIIDSIKGQAIQALGDGRGLQSPENGLPSEDASQANENSISHPAEPDIHDYLGDGNIEGGFSWNLDEFDAEFLDREYVRASDAISASPNVQSNNQRTAERFSDPVDPGADGIISEPMVNFNSSDAF